MQISTKESQILSWFVKLIFNYIFVVSYEKVVANTSYNFSYPT